MKIYKYPLKIEDKFVIRLPFFSRVLSLQNQGGVPTLWCEVNESSPPKDFEILCVGTGDNVPGCSYQYIDTVQIGIFVWHFYINMGG